MIYWRDILLGVIHGCAIAGGIFAILMLIHLIVSTLA